MKSLFAVIGKASKEGFSKTRLEMDIGIIFAQHLYCAFIADFFRNLAENKHLCEKGFTLFITPNTAESKKFFMDLLPEKLKSIVDFKFQKDGNLFERLITLFKDIDGETFVHLTGTDIPDFPFSYLDQVKDPDKLYLGEDEDGGFYYLGSKAKYYKVFELTNYEKVFESIVEQALSLGLEVVELPKWSDIDDFSDLKKTLKRADPLLIRETRKVCKEFLF